MIMAKRTIALIFAVCMVVFKGTVAGGADESSLPDFSDDERAYQEKSWNSMIGCCIARHFAAEAYAKGEDKVIMNKIIMEQHCEKYKGMFKDQCYRITPKVLSGIEPGTVRAPRKILDAAIVETKTCKHDYRKDAKKKKKAQKVDSSKAGCEGGGCSVHTKLAQIVVEGDLQLWKKTVKAMDYGGKYERASIPPIIHFIFGMAPDFGGKPFDLVHYLAVKSAYDVMPDATIFIYYKHEPKTEWWEKAMRLPVSPVKVSPVEKVGKWKIGHVAHVADLLRLQALRDMGGIYMDMDVVTLRPFDGLMRSNHFVMGQEGENGVYGLCNAVLMSSPNSTFVNLWLDHYSEAYDPNIWSMHSVKLPSIIGHLYPNHLTQVKDKTFFYPLWDKLDHMYAGHGDEFPENIAMHLWESLAHDKYISRLSEEYILNVDNNFNNAVRRFFRK